MTDNIEVEHLEAHDGAQLYCQHYPAKDERGVIITVHDYGQHSGAYEAAHQLLVDGHFGVYTMDLRGHGRSAGERAAIEHFDDYLEDLDLLIARVKDRQEEKPLFLLGQGMGALIALRYVTTRRSTFHGLILCGGLPLLPIHSKERLISQYAGILLNHIKANNEAREILLAPSLIGALKDDELSFRGDIKARTVAQINAANAFVNEGQEFLGFPVLCLASERHHILMERIHNKILTHDKTLIDYEGQSLQPLLGEERREVSQEIVKWCNEHLEKIDDEDEWGDPEDDSL